MNKLFKLLDNHLKTNSYFVNNKKKNLTHLKKISYLIVLFSINLTNVYILISG